jgi:uncharacterized protein with PIN domain
MRKRALVRFYAELNDFLRPRQRAQDLEYLFDVGGSIKDMIESFGVPHTEVELVVVNGKPVELSHRAHDGDRVSVYPMFESMDVRGSGVRSHPLRDPRFVLDGHLGRLARDLRLFGFDSVYGKDQHDAELVETAQSEDRLLLTRDVGLLKRSALMRGYFVRNVRPRDQMIEVMARFDLAGAASPFTRCLVCNGHLIPTDIGAIVDRVPERARRAHDHFTSCASCGRVYWKGSHHERMKALVGEVLDAVARRHEIS